MPLNNDPLPLNPDPASVRLARRWVSDVLQGLGRPDLVDSAELGVSELVTNAILHARTPLELGITVADESVLVTVHDLDLARREQTPYAGREGGWGLGLVTSLAEEAEMTPDPDGGKTAWFRLSRGAPREVPDGAAARRGGGSR